MRPPNGCRRDGADKATRLGSVPATPLRPSAIGEGGPGVGGPWGFEDHRSAEDMGRSEPLGPVISLKHLGFDPFPIGIQLFGRYL